MRVPFYRYICVIWLQCLVSAEAASVTTVINSRYGIVVTGVKSFICPQIIIIHSAADKQQTIFLSPTIV